jgi:hypothetical protein
VVDLPIIYGLGDILIQEDGEATVGFIASHSEEESANLQATAISSNTNLLANEALLVSGTDALRTIYLRPKTNQSGESMVTVFVQDSGGHTVSKTFRLTVLAVNDPPQISAISNLETSVDQPTLAAAFNVSDVESPATALALAAESSNPALVPVANIELSGSDNSRTVRVAPAAGQFGFAVITVHVIDPEGARSSRTFEVLVNQTTGVPVIAQQPQGGTFSSGATVQLRVIATGPGPITYRWQKNGSPLPNETNSILRLPAITRAGTGDYNVIVSNSAGSAVSAVAIVRVFDSTRIVNFTRTGNVVQFSFNTISGQRYTAEYQDALGVGPWNVLGEIDGSGAMATMTDPNATAPTRFYRVRIQ